MNPFASSHRLKPAPLPDAEWMPPQLPGVMREAESHPLSERIALAIVWSAEAATEARRTRAAIYPLAPYRDAAWGIMLHLLFEEAHDRPVTIDALAALDDLPPGKSAFWAEILEKLGLVRQVAVPNGGATLVWLTPAARYVLLELLLEPTTWNGPLLTQNITISQLWQLSQSHNRLD